MDRTNGRISPQINHDSKHYVNHDHTYSRLETKKNYFKAHPYDTYSRFCKHRSSFSSNYKSNEIRSAEQRSDKQFVASISFGNSLVKQRSSGHRASKHESTDYRSVEFISTDHGTSDHVSIDIPNLANQRTTDHCSVKFLSQDDIAKGLLMKVYLVIEPDLRKFLHCIFNDKQDSETLEMYAMKRGTESKWQKHFCDEQIKNIRQSPNFHTFDSTLIFRCIEVLRDFNPMLIRNVDLKNHIDNTMTELKSTRNLLCHNRKSLTAKECHDKANNLKKTLGDLLEIMHIWDRAMNITNEKMIMCKKIEDVMNGGLSEEHFRYMSLLKVINCSVEPVLSKVTQLICYDKKTKETFKDCFKRNGMNARTYKDTFFKEEKLILENHFEKMQPDITLHCKIIDACRMWHPSLKDDEKITNKLTKNTRQLRVIRNHAIHNMLSMSSNECNAKAQELGDSLKNLVDIVNFIQNKNLDMVMDAAKINTNQINSEINSIMSMPCPFL